MKGKLGIVAGSGALPRRLVESCRTAGRDVFVLALEGSAEPATVHNVSHAWCRIGAAAAGLALLRDNNVSELVLAGGIRRPSLAALRPDWRAAKLFARIGYRALGDDGLLSAVVSELEQEGFRVIGADQLLDRALVSEGPLGEIRPDAQSTADIEHGLRIARALGGLDVGQAVIVQQGLVLGVEAIEGTATRSFVPPIVQGCSWSASADCDGNRSDLHFPYCWRTVGRRPWWCVDSGAAAAHRRKSSDRRHRR